MRAISRLFRIVIVTAAILAGVLVVAVLVTRTDRFHDWLRRYVTREMATVLNGDISIGRLSGDLFTGAELEDVRVTQAGKPVVLVRNIGLRYNALDFVTRGIVIDTIRITAPSITLVRTREGWNISSLVKAQQQEADRQGPTRPIRIAAIGISDGRVTIDDRTASASDSYRLPASIDRIDLAGDFAYEPVRMTVRLGHMSFRASQPELALNSLSGQVSVRDDDVYIDKLAVRTPESSVQVDGAIRDYLKTPQFNLTLTTDKFTVREFGGVVPALDDIALQASGELRSAGPLSDLQVNAAVRSSAGAVRAGLRGDLASETRTLHGDVQLSHVDPGQILHRRDLPTDINATARLELRGRTSEDASGRAEIDGSARGYGAAATIRGRVARAGESSPLAYDLSGRVSGVNAARLPLPASVPRLTTALTASYRVHGTGADPVADLRLTRSSIEGATLADGTTAHVEIRGRHLAYAAKGSIDELDPQRLGRALEVDALSADRMAGHLNAEFDINGSGRTLAELAGHADVRLHDSTFDGGRIPALSVSADVQHQALTATVRGQLEGIDPSRMSDRPALAGSVNGAIDLTLGVADLSRASDLGGLRAAGSIAVTPSRVGSIDIQTATVQGTLAGELAHLDKMHVESSAAIVEASGDVAVGEHGTSTLQYDATMTDLTQLGRIAEVDLAGTGRLLGKIEGNATSLRTDGTLSASHLKYGTNVAAMSLNGKYDVQVPHLAVRDSRAAADVTAAFVEAGGRQLREIVAKGTYAPGEATLDAAASDETRTVAARAKATFSEDARVVDVQELSLRSGNIAWKSDPSQPAHLTYDGRQLTVERLALVNGDQRIDASGVVTLTGADAAAAPASLTIQARNVDLSTLDDLTVGDRGLNGRLNASATLTGSVDDPHAKVEGAIENGAFRNVPFQSLTATVDYASAGARVDMALRQSEAAALTVRGSVPVAELRGQPAPADALPLDLRIESTPIDLGLVQGFTTALRNVTGTASANLRATGSITTPRIDGELSVQNGAFTIDPLETAFNQLNGHIVFAGDQVRVDTFRVLDDGGDPLDVTGGIVLKGEQIGHVDLTAKAQHFRLISGTLADVQANLDLHVAGEPVAPRIEGSLEVHEGRIEIDRILENLQIGLYATEAQGTTQAATGATAATAPGSSLPDALALNLQLRVPDNLVVRGNNVRIGGRGMSLGNVNITLGGDLHAEKAVGEQARLTGDIHTIRGFYELEGRRFDVARDGVVSFNGPDPTDPAIDITGTRDISGVEATVRVHGTAQRPAVSLSSNPPLEEADVLSLVLFNRPINDLGQGERASLAQTAQSVVGGMVAAPLAESLRNALNVDLLDIQAVSSEGSPSVTIGNQISERVFLQFRQLFGSAETTQVVLEYQLSNYLRLQSAFTEGGTDGQAGGSRPDQTGVDLIWTIKR
jgi:autotransporter translocation and assembly factor TamB